MQLRLYKTSRLPKIRAGLGFLIISCCLVLLIVYFLAQIYLTNTPLCFFKLLTGLPCPICGSTRALAALARLELATALRLNPFIVLVAITIPLVVILRIATGFKITLILKPHEKTLLGLLVFFLFFSNWLFLIIDGR